VETIDGAGEWWLPENPDHRVPGWLTYSVEDGARLRLVGALRDAWMDFGPSEGTRAVTEASLTQSGTYPRILGQIGSAAFTLEGCFRSRLENSLFGGGPSTETVHADRVFRGAWFEPGEGAGGDSVSVRLAHLVYWLRPNGLDERHWFPNGERGPGDPVIELSGSHVTSIEIPRPQTELRLEHWLGTDGDRIARRSITQDIVATIRCQEVRSWRDLLTLGGEFQDVVSLAMDRVACIESVSFTHPDLVQQIGDRSVPRSVDLFAKWADRSAWVEPRDLTPSDVLFHFDAVGPDGLARLLDASSRYRAELRRVMATRRERGMYNSDRLLNRCAALESFDRTRRGGQRASFADKITACAGLAGEPFERLVRSIDAWRRVLKRRRDHVAHHLETDGNDDGYIDLVMAESVYFLFVLCLLREADVPTGVFDLIEQNRRVNWLRDQLSTVLSSSPVSDL
jgi:hypothetical protein